MLQTFFEAYGIERSCEPTGCCALGTVSALDVLVPYGERGTMEEHDSMLMRRAIALAKTAKEAEGQAPIGCVIVLDGRIIAEGCNEVGPRCDPTAHAEIVAIGRAAAAVGQPELRGATLYSTLQPCGMCTMASIWAKVVRIVYGATRDQVHHMYFEDRHLGTLDFISDAYRDDMRVDGGVLGEECAELYYRPGDAVPDEKQGNQ